VAIESIVVPDLGGAEGAEIIEISVAAGDELEQEQAIVVVETDKASMDIPSTLAGKVTSISVKVGDKVSAGDVLLEIDVNEQAASANEAIPEKTEAKIEESAGSKDVEPSAESATAEEELTVLVPEGAENADIIEVCVAVGDEVAEGDSLVVLETDKASMEIPAPKAGKVLALSISEGEKTVEGGTILTLAVQGGTAPAQASAPTLTTATTPAASKEEVEAKPKSMPSAANPQAAKTQADDSKIIEASQSKDVYAGPSVRKFAREMAVDLTLVNGTGERGRIVKDDVKAFVKDVMTGEKPTPAGAVASGGAGIPAIPPIDFTQFGEIELEPMSKIKKLTAANMQRNWLNIPHVTQFDDVDITELEAFRKGLKPEAEKRGVKLTPLPFLLKACAAALVAEPSFNVSLHSDGEHIVKKNYVHIGIAVDSPIGLVVPVIRDVDKKGLWELAAEFMELVNKAREGKLTPKDMQGGCFTISSLGAMGGQGFTPIVNAPEVAILGVSRAEMKPKWNGSEFEPCNMLPLSLSYDHRAINGADAGRFFTYLNSVIEDIRRLLL
jgi:pyruvate dehydrogenase E2 component (dihydrolipoamide acetyltransferase)